VVVAVMMDLSHGRARR